MNVNEFPIEVTITIHFVLTIDPTDQYPLTAFAEFLTEQSLESTLLEAIIESFNDVLVEAYCWRKTRTGERNQPIPTFDNKDSHGSYYRRRTRVLP